MSIDLNRLTAHLSPQQQADIAKAYHRDAEHSTTAFLYCFFLGVFGVHRFYLHQWRKGFAHFVLPLAIAAVLVAGVGLKWSPLVALAVVIPLAVIALVWEIVDLFTIDHEVYTRNLKLAEQLIAASLLSEHAVERVADAKLESMLRSAQAQAATAGRHDQVVANVGSAALAAEESLAVGEPTPALDPGYAGAVETISADSQQSASAALSTDEYVATTTTQISGDPNDTRHADSSTAAAPASWSETEQYHLGALESSGSALSAEEIDSSGAGFASADASESAATADDFSLDQSLTRSHEASAFSVTDSAELMTTMAAAESMRDERQADSETEAPPTPLEAEAVTWPDHDPVHFDEPAMETAQAGYAGSQWADTGALSRGHDATDMSGYPGSVETIADIEGANASPLYVSLPAEESGAPSFFDSTDSASATDDFAAGSPADEPDDGLLVLIPDVGEPAEDLSAIQGEPASYPPSAPAAESYIPPTVPVFTAYDAPVLANEFEAAANEGAGQDETLAELAGGAALGAVAVGGVMEAASVGDTASGERREDVTMTVQPESAHHRMRHIRVVRQVKVGGEVIEEMAAEEYIDEDADPEPVRKRLEAMLRQQAGGPIAASNLPGDANAATES